MKCYGVPLERVCEAVASGANDSEWCSATVVVGHLRCEIEPQAATRLYQHWGNHAQVEARRQKPADVQLDQGSRYVVFRCLSWAKGLGFLRSRGPTGGDREYQLTQKGTELLKGET